MGVMSILKVIAEQQQQLIHTLATPLHLGVVDLVHWKVTVTSVASQVTMPASVANARLDDRVTFVGAEATSNETVGPMQPLRLRPEPI